MILVQFGWLCSNDFYLIKENLGFSFLQRFSPINDVPLSNINKCTFIFLSMC